METNNLNNCLSSDFHHPFTLTSPPSGETSAAHQNPRKKRTKFTRTDALHDSRGAAPSKPTKPARRPDPAAPKITRPCTECGKKFWSWKALFGHMRCHPERQWRGINPPPNLRRPETAEEEYSSSLTEEDHEAATWLLMLANGPAAASDQSPSLTTVNQGTPEYSDSVREADVDGVGPSSCGRFECSSCKKVFGSHQALGGHRASHKNVKGCYAITKNIDGGGGGGEEEDGGFHWPEKAAEDSNGGGGGGHKCGICLRVFSSGQALGGHMRCHWPPEKAAEDEDILDRPPPSRVCAFDLNLAATNDDASSEYVGLDLRLGL